MSVYRRQQSSDHYGPYGAAPGLAQMLDMQRTENERAFRRLQERAARMAREREGVIDFVSIDGIWQEPPK